MQLLQLPTSFPYDKKLLAKFPLKDAVLLEMVLDMFDLAVRLSFDDLKLDKVLRHLDGEDDGGDGEWHYHAGGVLYAADGVKDVGVALKQLGLLPTWLQSLEVLLAVHAYHLKKQNLLLMLQKCAAAEKNWRLWMMVEELLLNKDGDGLDILLYLASGGNGVYLNMMKQIFLRDHHLMDHLQLQDHLHHLQ